MNEKPTPKNPPGPVAPESPRDPLLRPGKRPGTSPSCRGWFRAGRWLLERERLRLETTEPDPPFHDPRPLQEGVRGILDRLGGSSAAIQQSLLEEWPELVGEELAKRTRPGPIQDRELTVFVRGSVWFSELKRNGSGMIEERVVARTGKRRVNRVVLRPDPEGLPK